jgi:hypothetical protein
MSELTETPLLINRESLSGLQYPEEEVLDSNEKKEKRFTDIKRGLLLGNNFKNKVKIIFEDKEGPKELQTTIWGVTDKRVILKEGHVIPIHRIHKIIE